ncbi:MAG TPA: hypothetical protein VHV83_18210, partial [Armatimonadota bacterium]|nr:hypothetical protein [Armatimonadota bacterium]
RPQDCSIEATFADGKPSIISHAYGKGKAVMFASIVSRPYTWGNGENLRSYLTALLSEAGVNPDFTVSTDEIERKPETAVLLRNLPGNRKLLTVVHFSAQPGTCSLTVNSITDETIAFVGSADDNCLQHIDGNRIDLKFQPYGWAVFTTEK